MTQPSALIFDLDGTLVHSVPDMHVSLNRVLAAMGRETLELPVVQSFVGNGVARLVERALETTGGASDEERARAVAVFLDHYATQKTVLTRPYPGVVACLQALSAQGVPMGICTNKPQEAAAEMCQALHLSQFFLDITGAQPDVPTKPDPTSLLNCAARMGAAMPQILYVGDSAVDFETAKNADVPFRLFNGGYLNHALPDLLPEHRFDSWETADFGF